MTITTQEDRTISPKAKVWLREKLATSQITQVHLARASGVAPQRISKALSVGLTPAELARICEGAPFSAPTKAELARVYAPDAMVSAGGVVRSGVTVDLAYWRRHIPEDVYATAASAMIVQADDRDVLVIVDENNNTSFATTITVG